MKTKFNFRRWPVTLAITKGQLQVSGFRRLISYIFLIFILLIALEGCEQKQTYLRSAPKRGFEKRIHNEVSNIWIINTHEHLPSESSALNRPADFNVFIKTYQASDLISAGLPELVDPRWEKIVQKLESKDISVDEKWDYIKDYWKETKTTAAGRAVLIATKDLYGIEDLNKNTCKELSARIEKVHKKDYYYNYVLREKAKIDMNIQTGMSESDYDKKYFREQLHIYPMLQLYTYNHIKSFSKDFQLPEINTLDDMDNSVDLLFQKALKYGVVGVKSNLAYYRTIQINDVSRLTAGELFNKMKDDPDKYLSIEEQNQWIDYMFNRILNACEKYDLPIQIHTGIQTFNGNFLFNTNPTLLTSTIMRFPKVKFLLLHSGYPFGGEIAALAKMFTNVYIDMTWTPLISPSYAVRYLREFIETVPQNKIMAFGGDCTTVEGTYGASVLAREVVAETLVPMVREGYLSEEEAVVLARKLLRENAIRIFKLDFLK